MSDTPDWRLTSDEERLEERKRELTPPTHVKSWSHGDPVEKARRKDLAVESFAQWGNIREAARCAGIDRGTFYDWLKADPEFKARIDQAKQDSIDRLEQELYRRAVIGREEPVFYQGALVGTVKKPSDLLGIFIMKGEKPEKYRERFEHSGPGGGPIEQRVTEVRVTVVEPGGDDK